MALATETDPVETLRLILLNQTVAGDWSVTGAKPSHIEKLRETDRQTKLNRAYNAGAEAVYLWSPEVGTFPQFDAAWDYEDVQVVQADCWSADPDTAGYVAEDLKDILFGSWVRDNKASTAWNEIAPTQVSDDRATTPAEPGNKAYEVAVQVRLGRLVEP